VVVSPSGSSELDEEAVRAFRATAFPNPPEQLIQKDNLFTFTFGLTFFPTPQTPTSGPQ